MEEIFNRIQTLENKKNEINKKRTSLLKIMLEEETKINTTLKQEKIRLIKDFDKQNKIFEQTKTIYNAYKLLKNFEMLSLTMQNSIELKEKSKILLDYFFEIEDVESIVKMLKLRNCSFLRTDYFKLKKEEYLKKLKEDSGFSYTDLAKYVVGGQDEDIHNLIRLVARLDKKISPQKICYSKKTKEILLSVCVGELGKFFTHLYSDGKFGNFDFDRYCFTQIYKDEFFKSNIETKDL